MRRFGFLIIPLLAVFAFGGCGKKESPAIDESAGKVELYQKGKGVRFDDGTKQLFGVEVIDVTEKTFARTLTNTAHVFETGGGMIRATMPVAETATNMFAVGRRAQVTFADHSVTGSITGIQRSLTATEAIVEFPSGTNELAIGTFVTVVIQSEPKSVTVVPRDAVLSAADGDYVYVVNGKHLTRTKVKTGGAFDGFVEIVDGLYTGDSVAATAVNSLWFVELSALKGGKPCCAAPKKN